MTPLRESAAEFINASFLRQLGYQMAGNQIAKLPETAELCSRWTGVFWFFHSLPSGRFQTSRPSLLEVHFFPLWDACDRELGVYDRIDGPIRGLEAHFGKNLREALDEFIALLNERGL